ncbi:hypothetical protein AB0F07_29600 [Streptomyces fructofermentans]|uniref:hypothetical protein n=1 Tax=Streptomyces fructofermentans TaxID=152141 RepID=UPI0033E02064
MQQDVTVSLVSSFLAFVLGWLLRAGTHYYRTRRPAARVWQLDRGRRLVMVVGESGGATPGYPKIPEADALAAMNLRQCLSQDLRLHEVTVVRAKKFAMAADAEENLVVIGGPVHNTRWQVMADRLNIPFVFRQFPDGYRIVSEDNGDEYGESDVDAATFVDHAIVVLARNPFAPGSRLIMIAGCALLATSGATHLFARGGVRALAKAYDTRSPLALVVRVESVGGYVRPPEVVAAATFTQAVAGRTVPATRS